MSKALHLACWNADGVRGRKLVVEHFLSQHGVVICLLRHSQTLAKPSGMPIVCCRRLTAGDCTAIWVRPWYNPPLVHVPGLTNLEATAIQLILAGRPVKILAVYLSSSRLLIEADLSACFGLVRRRSQRQTRGLELTAKHETGKLLRDYADYNSFLIYGPDTPTTNPYKPSANPDDLDIVIEDGPFPAYLTSCSQLSSDHLSVLIETACRSPFQHPSDGPDFRRTDWAKFQTHLEDKIPFDPELHNGMTIDTCAENFSGAVLKAVTASTLKCRPRDDPRPPMPASI